MDNRLEKIRQFKASVMDFESYINDRIKQTKNENKTNEGYSYHDIGIVIQNEIEKILGKKYVLEYIDNYPLDHEDIPQTDTRPYVNEIYSYYYNIMDERVEVNAYISNTNHKIKYISFSFNNTSLNPISMKIDTENEDPISINQLKNQNKRDINKSIRELVRRILEIDEVNRLKNGRSCLYHKNKKDKMKIDYLKNKYYNMFESNDDDSEYIDDL